MVIIPHNGLVSTAHFYSLMLVTQEKYRISKAKCKCKRELIWVPFYNRSNVVNVTKMCEMSARVSIPM